MHIQKVTKDNLYSSYSYLRTEQMEQEHEQESHTHIWDIHLTERIRIVFHFNLIGRVCIMKKLFLCFLLFVPTASIYGQKIETSILGSRARDQIRAWAEKKALKKHERKVDQFEMKCNNRNGTLKIDWWSLRAHRGGKWSFAKATTQITCVYEEK